MTSLIDVIFLLLLFFMLSSTFSRYADIPLVTAARAAATADARPVFLQLGTDTLRLNGQALALRDLPEGLGRIEAGQSLLVSLGPEVSAQRLTDLLVVLQALPDLRYTVLGR
jgi:biopolymer transport protein ExbD